MYMCDTRVCVKVTLDNSIGDDEPKSPRKDVWIGLAMICPVKELVTSKRPFLHPRTKANDEQREREHEREPKPMSDNDAWGSIERISSLLVHAELQRLQRASRQHLFIFTLWWDQQHLFIFVIVEPATLLYIYMRLGTWEGGLKWQMVDGREEERSNEPPKRFAQCTHT